MTGIQVDIAWIVPAFALGFTACAGIFGWLRSRRAG